jgi:hypothetical protein
MKFETLDVRILYTAGRLKIVASELAKYNLDSVAVQEVKRNEVGNEPADRYTFFYRNVDANHHFRTGVFVCKGIRSAVKTAEFVIDRMSYITPSVRCCYIIALNMHAPINDKGKR